MVSIRFLGECPCSSIVCLQIFSERGSTVGLSRRCCSGERARSELWRVCGSFRIVGQFRLSCVEVVRLREFVNPFTVGSDSLVAQWFLANWPVVCEFFE